MDNDATNYNYQAEEDDGSCTYSKAIFYVTGPPNYPPLTLYINGSAQGVISAFYPSGPGNCSATGCPTYQFTSGSTVDWEVKDAAFNIVNGTVSPMSSQECIKVQVY